MTKGRLNLDLDDFKPEPKNIELSNKDIVKSLSEEAGFKTKHSVSKSSKLEDKGVEPETKRRGRKRSTNRNTPFAVKLKIETNNRIYELADELDCNAIAEVIEMAIAALDKNLREKKPK